MDLKQVEHLVGRLQQGGLLYPAASKEAGIARLEVWSASLNEHHVLEFEATRAAMAYFALASDQKPRNFGPGDLIQTVLYERSRNPQPSRWLTEANPRAGNERGKPFWDSDDQRELTEAVARENPLVVKGRLSDGTLLHYIHKLAVLAGLIGKTSETLTDGNYHCGNEGCGECA